MKNRGVSKVVLFIFTMFILLGLVTSLSYGQDSDETMVGLSPEDLSLNPSEGPIDGVEGVLIGKNLTKIDKFTLESSDEIKDGSLINRYESGGDNGLPNNIKKVTRTIGLYLDDKKIDIRQIDKEKNSLSFIIPKIFNQDKLEKDIIVKYKILIDYRDEEGIVLEDEVKLVGAFKYIIDYKPTISSIVPNPIAVSSEGVLDPEMRQLIVEGENFLVYRYDTTDENGNFKPVYKYPVIDLVPDKNGKPGQADVVVNKNLDNKINMYVYKDGKLVDGKEGNRLGNKLVLNIPKGLKIKKENIGQVKSLRLTNPLINKEAIKVLGDGSISQMGSSFELQGIRYIDYSESPDKIPKITNIVPSTILTTGKEDVKILGENIPEKDKLKIYLGGKDISSNIKSVNREKGQIILDLPPRDEGTYDIMVKNTEGSYDNIGIEYVKEFTTASDFESISIIKKAPLYGNNNGNNNKFLIGDFLDETSSLEFRLDSKNTISQEYFDNKIKQLRLVRKSDGREVIIKKGKTSEKSQENTFSLLNGQVYIKLDETTKKELSYGSKFPECYNRPTGAGEYEIFLDISGEASRKLSVKIDLGGDSQGSYLFLSIKDKPWVEGTFPRAGDTFYNPNYLYREYTNEDGSKEKGYYISVYFNDLGRLSLVKGKEASPLGISLVVEGSNDNLVDDKKKLRLEVNNLYIPLKDKLEDGKTYLVNMPANNYIEYGEYNTGDLGEEARREGYKNKCYSWKFGTNSVPIFNDIFEGSIVEDYDNKYPIILEGEGFSKRTKVLFEDVEGDRYSADSVSYRELDGGLGRLDVYLPRRRDRLRPGQYKIIIRNSYDHKTELEYGIFSVVERGREVPNEDYTIKEDNYYGDIVSNKKKSEDTLELRYYYRNKNYLRINLDEIMGQDTWSRSLKYPLGCSDSINTLKLESKWADIKIDNLRLADPNNGKTIDLKVGRVAPGLIGNLKGKLMGYRVKSEFIEVVGENCVFDKVTIEIPYNYSGESTLSLMRYDEDSRMFEDIESELEDDKINNRVSGTSKNPGIFVIVE